MERAIFASPSAVLSGSSSTSLSLLPTHHTFNSAKSESKNTLYFPADLKDADTIEKLNVRPILSEHPFPFYLMC